MMNLSEYRRSAARLADYLPWAALIAPGVVLNKDGSFQRSASFRGPDLESAVAAELVAVAGRLNNAFRRLGSGWAIFVEAQRSPSSAYPDSRFPDPASALVDAERRAEFEGEADQGSSRGDDPRPNDSHFVSEYFLTFLWLPPAEEAARAESWLYEGRETSGVNPRELLRGFLDRTERVLALLDGFMPECRWLDDAEVLTYLHSTISTNRHRVCVPEVPMHLDALLADQPLTGGLEPRLGDRHLRVLTITGFPTATTPGILDDLNRLAFPYRWSTRAILMDKVDATKMVTKIRRQWFAKRKSIAAILKEVMTNEQSALVDTDAANKALDADLALQELGDDVAGMAWVTATIVVQDSDPRRADEKLRLVEKVIQGRDFTAMTETVNAVDAWLGSLPGHAYANVRQPPVSTLNLAHMIPLSAVWAGAERDEHLGGPPLLYGRTEGSTPFRFSLHVGDVGHTLVVGPTGAGKSVLLALMALQFRRYARSQIFAFDFGGSIRAAALAMGGDWHDLGGSLTEGDEASVALQPLARTHETSERAWAADWIAAILAREGVGITPEVREYLWTALTSLASAPVAERTITGLSVLLQSNDLKQALRPYCIGGASGRLLDAEAEHLGTASVQAFEIEGLVGTAAAPAVLSYLFHRIGDRLDGRPTLLIIDEGWLALDDEGFAGQLREWLKTLRKKNASVIFATQSLSDIDNSAIAPAIIESCPTRLLLPNERAIEPQITEIYRRFGLNDRQIEILARATPKRDYYCQSRRGNRLFELGLSEVGLALCAASSKSDQALIGEILAAHGREGFLDAWLRARGVGWAADLIPDLTILVPEAEGEGSGRGNGAAADAATAPAPNPADPGDDFAAYDTISDKEIAP
ncbi:conjugal transfer protein TrbE [Paracoccus kondratievae]|uniref:conjugal transfer protein TrbE n=1 Tax=Paracoccus kondratievae TaxID=135740 RepID=UPI00126669BB|nr:conjugal transfer protein TrbE [Paracoccus kondratievae]QFQ88829.1 conjugal transfer protein TrbE [Paracoccus kondratievae]